MCCNCYHTLNLHFSFSTVLEYAAMVKKDVYVSRHFGNDSQFCGSIAEPCRTLARGIEIADHNDRVLLDGTLTKSNPYNCTTGKPRRVLFEGNGSISIHVSLEITAISSPAYMSCEKLLQFIGLPSRGKTMNVNISGIVFVNTSLKFVDSSVSFVHCSFRQAVNQIEITLAFQQTASLTVESSIFFNNAGCIRVELTRHTTNVAIKLNKVRFLQNSPFLEQEGGGISIYSKTQNEAKKVSVSVSCKNTVFSGNTGPLITNNANVSESNEVYQDVKFLRNYGLNRTAGESLYFSMAKNTVCIFDNFVSTGNTNSRCVEFRSYKVKLEVLNSHFGGHTLSSVGSCGGVFLVKAKHSMIVIINESYFSGNKADNGGALALNSTEAIINLIVVKSNFTTNSAARYGGVLFVESKRGPVNFRASHSTWLANRGSAVFIAPCSKTTVVVESCKFISNYLDRCYGNFVVRSTVGLIQVSLTQWRRNSQGIYVECNCVVNFTKVNVTGCKGRALTIFSKKGTNTTVPMKLYFDQCLFRANKENDISISSTNNYLELSLSLINFYEKKVIKGQGYSALAVLVGDTALRSQILMDNIHIEDFVGAASVSLRLEGAENVITLKNSKFRTIKSYFSERYHTEASPLSFIVRYDHLHHNICSRPYVSYQYRSSIIIENTSFVDNIGHMSGGVYGQNGNITIRYCTFENNFAIQSGGNIHVTDGTAAIQIENSYFRQSLEEKTFANETYVHDTSIYSESTGPLLLQKTLVVTDLEKSSYRLFTVTKAGAVIFDKFTSVQCAVGSALRLDNFSHFIIWPYDLQCKLKMTVLTLSCHQCPLNMYSLERGEVTTLQGRSNTSFKPFSCRFCPNGANCSRNIFAKPNYWGYPDSSDRMQSLKFVHCPPSYCAPTTGRQITNLSVYNRCYGNRDGIMCGKCKNGFTETLFSKKCEQNVNCKDKWVLILIPIYVATLALLFIFEPPIIKILVRNTLWFRRTLPYMMEYQPLARRDNFSKGFTKIIFYFYQIASYLTLQSFTEMAREAPYLSFFIGLFNFQTRISQGGLGCPFPGLTVVTKELIHALVVIATLLAIQLILVLHFCFNKLMKRQPPTKARYYGATLRTLLLGYAILANASLKLLTCVPVLGERRLFFDGNIKCLAWWQYLLIVFIVAFLIPFVVVIHWGAMKLRRKRISVEHFIIACFFPLGFLLYWLLQKFLGWRYHNQVASESQQVILKVLHDPFRSPTPGQTGTLYWESVFIGRRFLLLSYQVFFPDPLVRLFCMAITCVLVFTWHVATKPFRDWKANVLEAICLAVLVVIANINLVQAFFLSAGATPEGSVKSNVNILQQIEIILLGVFPFFLALLLLFAVISQVLRLIVLVFKFLVHLFRKIFTFAIIRQIRARRQQYDSIN